MIVGARIGEEIVCEGCLTMEERAALKADEVITESQTVNSGDIYFCDRCKKQLI